MHYAQISLCKGTFLKGSFKSFALNSCVSKVLSEEVLASVPTSVATKPYNRYDHVLILLIVSEEMFESI